MEWLVAVDGGWFGLERRGKTRMVSSPLFAFVMQLEEVVARRKKRVPPCKVGLKISPPQENVEAKR